MRTHPDRLPDAPGSTPPRALTWRSVLIGMTGVAGLCLLTPYNDYVLWNTFLVGNNLPLGAVMLLFLLAALVNGPLSRWKPSWMLSRGELGIIMAMMLIGSALPSSALMRYFPGSLAYQFELAGSDPEIAGLLERIGLKDYLWLYPTVSGETPQDWARDPVILGFVTRWADQDSPPYAAWLRPGIIWGIYFLAFHGAILCLLAMVRRQWYDNERLTFPLAQIQLSLLEPPQPGRWFGGTLAKRAFWIVFFGINIIHAINALHVYQPQYFPEIPVRYNLNEIFSEQPLSYMNWSLKSATIFFTAVGVAYLLPGSVSFSLWFFTVAVSLYQIPLGMATNEPNMPGLRDQHYGGMVAYAGIVLWIGRRHWWLILRQAFRGEREGEPRGRYLSYCTAFWGFVAFVCVMIGWLWFAGCTLGAAVLVTSVILLGFFLIARIVAETGLLHPGNLISSLRAWQVMSWYTGESPVPVSTLYRAANVQLIHYDARESFGVFASHAIKVSDETAFEGRAPDSRADRSTGRKLIALFGTVVVVGFVLSLASMLWVEYRYWYEVHDQEPLPVNRHVATAAVRSEIMNPTLQYERHNYNFTHDPATHLAGGAVGTLALAVMRLRYAWWPFHPIGYLFMDTWPMRMLWFSIMLGWLVRTLALRFGGAKLYTTLQPAMMGLIIGEAVASATWLVLGLLFSSAGMSFYPIRFTLY